MGIEWANRRIDLEEISSRWTGEEDLSVKVALVVGFCPCDEWTFF